MLKHEETHARHAMHSTRTTGHYPQGPSAPSSTTTIRTPHRNPPPRSQGLWREAAIAAATGCKPKLSKNRAQRDSEGTHMRTPPHTTKLPPTLAQDAAYCCNHEDAAVQEIPPEQLLLAIRPRPRAPRRRGWWGPAGRGAGTREDTTRPTTNPTPTGPHTASPAACTKRRLRPCPSNLAQLANASSEPAAPEQKCMPPASPKPDPDR